MPAWGSKAAVRATTALSLLLSRYCCKSRFVPMIKNSAGRGFSFRVRMWGTSSPHVKRAGDFGNATEGTRIGDQFPSCVFAKNSEPCNFRLLQQYLPQADMRLRSIISWARATDRHPTLQFARVPSRRCRAGAAGPETPFAGCSDFHTSDRACGDRLASSE